MFLGLFIWTIWDAIGILFLGVLGVFTLCSLLFGRRKP